ncbi:SDR family NAD(P)-dependent oxidoreductase [Paenibacillus antri]|uniref:SDR family NAD(P)-dependent oxidoreductase n=1 Tax=Paenibacillus antri TaxID=2582848 RepID=A0A5R9G9Y5_9BACL|nr:SDR family NAD(P)-dependent oxidoreductase [Paenibacillus antri]TLS50890.1 SDR family NAD(P)-dependent oxidoreductase [Paenibacillus antri]
MNEKRICITGTDRGVGLALTRLYLERGDTVFAGGIVKENEAIAELRDRYPGRLHDFYVDIGDDRSVKEAAAFVGSRTDRLDLLLNNAAVLGDTTKTIRDDIDFDEVQRNYNITAVGAIRMTNALLEPVMNGGKLIANISSEAGSIAQSYRDAWFGYCMAKAALNMGSTIVHNGIRKDGGRVMLFHPGWVKSMMSGTFTAEATYTPEESAANIVRRIDERGHEIHELPLYLEADTGRTLPW